jgi:DinB superfamily
MKNDQSLRDKLTKHMRGGQAFAPMEEVLAGITIGEAGRSVAGLPYTLWGLIEHLRITLYDILEFSRDPAYQSPEWPEGYWPPQKSPADQAGLDKSIQALSAGVEAMVALVQDPARDLFEPFAHGQGQNLLREAMLVAEHNAYHLGQVVLLRRLLGTWK